MGSRNPMPHTSEEDREVMMDAAWALFAHVEADEMLDIVDAATGERVGYVVRTLRGREFEVRLRTGEPVVDALPRECPECGAPFDSGGPTCGCDQPPFEPFYDDPDYAAPEKF